ncbi:GMC family oxidoreductase [Oricola cellulosilytica]|uniref:Glucose-methanol-choline oxidoreductase n=1 Tax=Oricola cellulosilytica TaxID=1429082 RepID=A0A4R0P357_9HYPH|nr:GMC family oxidoreductase N-terminal domain-containing protein [Oricola cellulosilytica]TCD10991.1 glucose-methanol-choline oxidoreductase [Oricola cellulosilytica]
MEFDYAIAGGGSAGSALAARLSEDPKVTVCLIEAGGEGKDLLIRAPLGVITMLPGYGKFNNWAYQTVPQPGLNGRRGYQPRGRALGGSSAINAMLYVRGHPSDYDGWAADGCTGWAWDDVLPYFRNSERNERGGDRLHGADGPLHVSEQKSVRPVSQAFVDACTQMQLSRNADFNGPEQEGAGIYQVTQFHGGKREGERCSAAAAYLHPVMNRPNLKVVTRALVSRVEFDGRRATGLAYRKGTDEMTVAARREVILCGGAFNSPQLLMLSGIGPAAELRQHGIEVRHDLPGVGKNLQDHVDFVLGWKTRDTDVLGLGPIGAWKIVRDIARWRRDGSGIVASPGAEAGAFVRSDPSQIRPDLQLHFVAALVDDHSRKLHLGYGYSCHVCVLRPHSRGEVSLASGDPSAAPLIDPKFLSDERDAALLLHGAKITRRILEAPALSPYRLREVYLDGVKTDDELMAHIRSRADTVYHPSGTCKMGLDERSVVDPQLRVYGVNSLRVVDVSIMPNLIGGNTNAPAMMIAEKAADLIREAAAA